MTLRSKRFAIRVSTKSHVEAPVSSIIPPTRYHATPPPCPKNRTVRSVSPPVVIIVPTYGSPSIEVHRHADFQDLADRLQVGGARAHGAGHDVILVLERTRDRVGIDDGSA